MEPEPLVPSNVDLRGLTWMPYYGDCLSRSELNARISDAGYRAAHNLWWAAWNSVPAASLPDDDVLLARAADLGRDLRTFRRIKEEALHGFIRCSDGRLYHRFLAELANDAWNRRINQRRRKQEWRLKNNDKLHDVTGTGVGQRVGQNGQETRRQDRTGQDRTDSVPKGTGAAAPSDPIKALWDRAIRILGPTSRSLIGKARREHGDLAVATALTLCEEAHPSDPVPFFIKTVRGQQLSLAERYPNEGIY